MSEAQDYCHHLEFVQQCTIKTHVDGNGSIFVENDIYAGPNLLICLDGRVL